MGGPRQPSRGQARRSRHRLRDRKGLAHPFRRPAFSEPHQEGSPAVEGALGPWATWANSLKRSVAGVPGPWLTCMPSVWPHPGQMNRPMACRGSDPTAARRIRSRRSCRTARNPDHRGTQPRIASRLRRRFRTCIDWRHRPPGSDGVRMIGHGPRPRLRM
jgi:hypothetical protein